MEVNKILGELRSALKHENRSVIAEKTGLHYNTVRAVLRDDGDANPSMATIAALQTYLKNK